MKRISLWPQTPHDTTNIKLGLRANWPQFTLLVIINAFIGGMVGLERTIFPELASSVFGVASHTAILSFIAAFGLAKGASNYFSGKMANQLGRRKLLLIGWALALPIPFILMNANHWNWVIFANLLLGISQGLSWSSTVVMKIDLVGDKDRGLAMGLNEFAGYLAVGIVALLSGYVANVYGITPYPFYIGVFLSITGFLLTLFFVQDTRAFARKESLNNTPNSLDRVFWDTTFKNKTLSSITQAGLINNLNDGMIWGLLPIILLSQHYRVQDVGIITAIYPAIWGIGQLFTGKMSDLYSKKKMLFGGMLLQGLAILLIPISHQFATFVAISTVLGIGTALVYPTFLSALAAATHPMQRPESMGVFRLWRDLGYTFGALLSGFTADLFGPVYAIVLIGALTLFSALVIQWRMPS